MNSALRAILDSYEDFELANLSHYKLSTYLPETQNSIKDYLLNRGLTKNEIDNLLLKTKEMTLSDNQERCPRCKSRKLITERVEWTETAFKAGYSDEVASYDGLFGKATYKDQIVCEVCGLFIKDPNKESSSKETIWKRLYDFLFDKPFGL